MSRTETRLRARGYRQARDYPALRGVSYLSVHLRFGTISIRTLVAAALAQSDDGGRAWLDELIWRDFYFSILYQFPHVVAHAFRRELEHLPFSNREDLFAAWCEGRTGYPLVDAAMRQLNTSGYMHNRLREPGGITLAGVPIDLAKVNLPTYFVSAIEDHIAPWKTTCAGPGLMKGSARFVLSGSGHIAGMINPPAANKYGYWTNEERADDADAWFEKAVQHDGSWWPDWRKWIASYLDREVPARIPGKGKLPAIEAAPGAYARLRADGT